MMAASVDRRMLDAATFSEQVQRLAPIADNATRWLFLNDAGIASAGGEQ